MIYDVAIIGAGIVGASIGRVLSQYKLHTCIIEKNSDVSCGTSKANSGIIHAGYDPMPGTLMAQLNVKGSELYPKWASELHFEYKKIGSLVIGFTPTDMEHIQKLYDRGLTNGVKNMRILNKEELHKLEPEVNEDACGALLAESAAIISPYQATWAIAENAVQNGVKLFLNAQVHGITAPSKNDDSMELWTIHTGKGDIQAKYVVNAAGLFADSISRMAGARNFIIVPRRGEYFLLDNKCSTMAHHTLFQTPDAMGKGVLITPTVDGNILVGPSAGDTLDKEDEATTRIGQDFIFNKGEKTIPEIPRRNIINSFAGTRAIAYNPVENPVQNPVDIETSTSTPGTPVNDFIIEEDPNAFKFINVAGICSPGLTAAPAIGEYVSELLKKAGLELNRNSDYIPVHKGIESFKEANIERRQELIEENPLYGRIICRCEMITEAEIVHAIHSPIGASDLDGVKRRTRAGMGRCQGGFCSPRVTEIISRELDIPMTSVTKSGGCSFILNSKTR